MNQTESHQIGLIADPESALVRESLFRELDHLGVSLVDLTQPRFDDLEDNEIAAVAINSIKTKKVRVVILLSRSGNGLQMHANKDLAIRAAPCRSAADVEEAVSVWSANMCEFSSVVLSQAELVSLCQKFIQQAFQT